MTNEHDEMLEKQLAELSVWSGAEPEVWRIALRQSRKKGRKGSPMVMRFLRMPMPNMLAASVGIVLASAVLIALLTSNGGLNGLVAHRRALSSANVKQIGAGGATYSAEYGSRELALINDKFGSGGVGGGYGGGGRPASLAAAQDFSSSIEARAVFHDGQESQFSTSTNTDQTQSSTGRQVIRKATLELITDDVRAAFVKAMHAISQAGGEYIQDSSLTGTGKETQGNLTLRVAADRLSDVMNELRGLGKVTSENLGGEDVTAQAVDLDARLRNETRIETEMLQLLEKRNEAPLKEILELREQIGNVRQQIEQLTAQRERLSRLISLATILVIIRPDNAPVQEKTKTESISGHFLDSIAAAWRNGLLLLADTMAGALRVIVGGLLWWAALIIALLALRQYVARRTAIERAL